MTSPDTVARTAVTTRITDNLPGPWEPARDETSSPAADAEGLSLNDHATGLLEGLGIDTTSSPTKGTGRRFATAMRNLTYGLHVNPGRYLETLTRHTPDGFHTPAAHIAVCAIPVRGICTCHALPYTGTVDVAHLPPGGGVYPHAGQITRFVQALAARPTNPETLIHSIVAVLAGRLGALTNGVAARVTLRPMCDLMHNGSSSAAVTAFHATGDLLDPAQHTALLTAWSTR
ncbi:GTP cyclohydrolase I [Streptosporangium sp. NPDC051022]|uniref:GTP cyclohydrolase I n=1 Tax=Streptosporangium sp. NPDC051022 TaxID=3155752 RepID=UPI00341E49DA